MDLGFDKDGAHYTTMDLDDNGLPNPSLEPDKVTPSTPWKHTSISQKSTSITPKSGISNVRGASIIDLDSPHKFTRVREATPPRSEKSKGKMKARALPTPIDLSEDDESDAEMPSVEQLWQGTQVRKSVVKAPSLRSSPLTPPPPTKIVRAREDESEFDSPPAKKARRKRKAVDSSDGEESDNAGHYSPAIDLHVEKMVESVARSEVNGKLSQSVARSRIADETDESSPADSPRERSRGSLKALPSKQKLQARHSEPSVPSPRKTDITPSKVKASTSLNNQEVSSKRSHPRAVTESRSVPKASPDRTIIGHVGVSPAQVGGRVRRQAATKAAVSLAESVKDMNAFQADFARSKGDPRKLSLAGLGGPSMSESTSRTMSADVSHRKSGSSVQVSTPT